MRITRLELTNWRNFRSASLELQRRLFLVGPNASGKSNLLDAIRFLRDLVIPSGGLQSAIVDRRGGMSRVRCLAARREPTVGIVVAIGDDDEPDRWVYELMFDSVKGRPQVPLIQREHVRAGGALVLERPDDDDRGDVERLTQTSLEQVTANRAFRPVAEFFSSVSYSHLVPQVIRQPERMSGLDESAGADFLERMARTRASTRDSRLRQITAALQIAVPQLSELELNQDKVDGMWHLRARYQHWRSYGAWQGERDFSDGTIRLIGFLWAILDGEGPRLLEEPEISLHPEVVRRLPSAMYRAQRRSGRQIIVTTNSVDLLADEGIGLDEVALLKPSANGTEVTQAASISQVEDVLDAGVPLGEIARAQTAPADLDRLAASL